MTISGTPPPPVVESNTQSVVEQPAVKPNTPPGGARNDVVEKPTSDWEKFNGAKDQPTSPLNPSALSEKTAVSPRQQLLTSFPESPEGEYSNLLRLVALPRHKSGVVLSTKHDLPDDRTSLISWTFKTDPNSDQVFEVVISGGKELSLFNKGLELQPNSSRDSKQKNDFIKENVPYGKAWEKYHEVEGSPKTFIFRIGGKGNEGSGILCRGGIRDALEAPLKVTIYPVNSEGQRGSDPQVESTINWVYEPDDGL